MNSDGTSYQLTNSIDEILKGLLLRSLTNSSSTILTRLRDYQCGSCGRVPPYKEHIQRLFGDLERRSRRTKMRFLHKLQKNYCFCELDISLTSGEQLTIRTREEDNLT